MSPSPAPRNPPKGPDAKPEQLTAANLLNLYDVVTLMPNLATAIRKSAAVQNKGPFRRYSTVYLDQVLKDWARDTLAVLPTHEFQKLANRAKDVLEQKGHTG